MISDSFQVDQNQTDLEQSSKQNLAHDDEMRWEEKIKYTNN